MELIAEQVHRPCEPCEAAGDGHRQEITAGHADSAVTRGLGVEADRAHLVAEGGPAEHDPEHDERGECEEEADVKTLQLRVTPEDRQLRARRDVGCVRVDAAEFLVLEWSPEADEVARDPERDPVEHDRRDHLVRADRGAEQSCDSRPGRSCECGQHDGEHDVRRFWHRREPDPRLNGDDGPDRVLALAADVEEAAPKREGDGEAREHQRGHDQQRLLEIESGVVARDPADPRKQPVQPSPVEDCAVRTKWILPGRRDDDESADDEGEERRDQRRDDSAGALVHGEPGGGARRIPLGSRFG